MTVCVRGALLAGLRGNQHLYSINLKELMAEAASMGGYRPAVALLNRVSRRGEGDELSHRTVNDVITREGKALEQADERFMKKVLGEHGFSAKTGRIKKNTPVPEEISNPRIELREDFAAQGKTVEELREDQNKEIIGYALWYNSKHEDPATQIRDLDKAMDCELKGSKTINLSPDGVVTKHQKEERADVDKGTEGKKSTQTVQNYNVHLEVDGKVLALVGSTLRKVLMMALAVLLSAGLLFNRELIVFTDGARDIKKHVSSIFSFCRVHFIVDWYHLQKKCNEYFSMALKSERYHKEERGRIRREFFARLWVGNVNEALAYLLTIDPAMIKNKGKLNELADYLNRKRYGIVCYAVRRHLGLRISSNRVEQLNGENISGRQKHNGMAWSYTGSYGLARLTTTLLNGHEFEWFATGEESYELGELGRRNNFVVMKKQWKAAKQTKKAA